MNLAAALYDYAQDASPMELEELGRRCVELAQHSFDGSMAAAYLRMANELLDLAHQSGCGPEILGPAYTLH